MSCSWVRTCGSAGVETDVCVLAQHKCAAKWAQITYKDRLIFEGGGSVSMNCSECLCKRTLSTCVAVGYQEKTEWKTPDGGSR